MGIRGGPPIRGEAAHGWGTRIISTRMIAVQARFGVPAGWIASHGQGGKLTVLYVSKSYTAARRPDCPA